MIPQPIKLTFDPYRSEELREIVANPIAWAIWLLWRPGHIVNQLFNREVIQIAERISKLKNPGSEQLVTAFVYGSNFWEGDVRQWLPEALPFLNGRLKIEITYP